MMLRTKEIKSPELTAELELLGASLRLGETSRGPCPKCKGGQSGEKSCFAISRDLGSICHYICFRASCGLSGRLSLGYTKWDHTETPKPRTRLMEYPVEALQSSDIDMFRAVYEITPDRDTFWCPAMDRYAHRVYGPIGQQRGWVLRDYSGGKNPKAISYPFRELTGPFVSWYYPTFSQNDDVIVVEDILSAKKCSDSGFKAVALLGTWMSLETAYEVAGVKGKGMVHLALDEGTMSPMLRTRDKFEVILGEIKIWSLKKDLKYVSRERIRKAAKDGDFNFRGDEDSEG